jgi:hypothetical protein
MTGRIDLSPWRGGSLRLRFLLAILLWVAIGIAGIWVSASRVFTKHIELQYHDELYGHVRELTGLVQVTQDGHLHLSARFPIRAILNQCPAFTGRSASITAIGSIPRRCCTANWTRISPTRPRYATSSRTGLPGPAIVYGLTGLTPMDGSSII